MRIAVIHGPNLNLLGNDILKAKGYGALTLAELNAALEQEARVLDCTLQIAQYNVEGDIVSAIHGAAAECRGLLLNAGGYTHTSVSIRDAVWATGIPTVEVHLTNIYAREEFRRHSLLGEVALATVAGFGPQSYVLALNGLVRQLQSSPLKG